MTRLIAFACLLLFLSGCNAPGNKDALAELQSQRISERWKEAYNSGDAANLIPLYAEDAEYLSGHVKGLAAQGRERVIENFQRGMSMGGHLDVVEVLSMDVSLDLAYVVTRYEANNAGEKVEGRNLLVLKKIGRAWLIVKHMTVV